MIAISSPFDTTLSMAKLTIRPKAQPLNESKAN